MKNSTKRLLTLILCGALTAALLTACGDKKAEPKWFADFENHWYGVEGGDKTELGQHVFESENDICTVCNFEIIDHQDGTFEVTEYDEFENAVYVGYYDAGKLLSTEKHVYTYSEKGDILSEKAYFDDVLTHEATYVLDDEDYPMLAKSISYEDDGGKTITEFNIHGDMTLDAEYDVNGTELYKITYEYKYDDDGQMLHHKAYNGNKLIENFEYKYDQYGTSYASTSTYFYDDGSSQVIEENDMCMITRDAIYNADGSIEEEMLYFYEFDDDGLPVSEKRTINGALDYEIIFFYDDGLYVGETKTTYNADGSYTVEIYDSDWTITSSILYDAEGNVIE